MPIHISEGQGFFFFLANAQTGNIVLLGQSLAEANFHDALKYILPIISFALGVYLCRKNPIDLQV